MSQRAGALAPPRYSRTQAAMLAMAEERIPKSRVHIFDRCGHAPSIEGAAELNKLVLEFLAS